MKIWDLFMIKGVKALFSAGLAFFDALKTELLEVTDLGKHLIA